MNPLDLTRICRLAPYKVWTEDGRDYYVETSRGQIFDIGFMDDYSIWPTGAYQFTISNQSHQPSPLDQKLRETILLLIEAFFAARSTFWSLCLQRTPISCSTSVRRATAGRHSAAVCSSDGSTTTRAAMPTSFRPPKCRRARPRTSQPLSCRSQTLASRKSSPNSTKPSAY